MLMIVTLSHAEDVTNCTTLGVANDNESKVQKSEADDSRLPVVLPPVFNLGSQSVKNLRYILEIQASVDQRPIALGRIAGDAHPVIVYTIIAACKRLLL